MATFAKLNNNNEVIDIIKVNNPVITDTNGVEQENLGIQFLNDIFKDNTVIWKKTSFNTKQGKYYNQDGSEGDISKAFRKNSARIGGIYDPIRDAFISLKPFNSWILNETTCDWESPIPYPNPSNGNLYQWNESTQTWDIAIPA
jgi:hypothetical protein